MAQNFLQLNESKGELILFGPTTAISKTTGSLGALATLIQPKVRNLGVIFDSDLRFDAQVSAVVGSCFYQLRLITSIKPFLFIRDLQRVIISLILSRLDYCNSLYIGLTDELTNRLQLIMNSAARMLTGTRMRDHISPVLASLHWLPVQERAQFKTLLFTYKALNGLAPDYISELLEYTSTQTSRTLRSGDQRLLHVPWSNLVSRGDRAFAVAAPRLWNALPLDIRTAPTLTSFKRELKTYFCHKLNY